MLRIAAGESVNQITQASSMPSSKTFYRWLAKHADFRQKYLEAKAIAAHVLAEQMLEIADDAQNDWMENLSDDNQGAVAFRLNGENVQRSRLRIETRKWLAKVLAPKSYGDRLASEVSGPDGAPLDRSLDVQVTFVKPNEG